LTGPAIRPIVKAERQARLIPVHGRVGRLRDARQDVLPPHDQPQVQGVHKRSTQTIEGFWATVKNGLRGVYHGVAACDLQSYVDEYVFRYNTRNDEQDPFLTLLNRAARV
jgi:hypothetical protein